MNTLLERTLALARGEAKRQGMSPSAARSHSLVLLSKLKAGKDSYDFSVAAADQQAIARDFAIGLLDKDGFFMSRLALLLLSVPIIGGKEHFSAAAAVSFPDRVIFNGAAADANSLSEVQQLEPLYTGKLGLTTNNDIRLEDFFTRSFRTVHTTQGSATTANEQHGCEFVEFGTVFSMNGFEKNIFNLKIESNDKSQLGGTAARATYAMLVAEGAIVKNLTSSMIGNK